jgi:PleD family two-component response regulator
VLEAFRAGAQDYIVQDTFVIHNLVESLRRLKLL